MLNKTESTHRQSGQEVSVKVADLGADRNSSVYGVKGLASIAASVADA